MILPDARDAAPRRLPYARNLGIRFIAALLILAGTAASWAAGLVHASNFLGVAASCAFVAVVSALTYAVRRPPTAGRQAGIASVVDRLCLVAGFTGIIYFLGGVEASYLCPLYVALTLYAGIISYRRIPYTTALQSALCFAFMVVLQHFAVLPDFGVFPGYAIPWPSQVAIVLVNGILVFMSASISSRAARTIEEGRARLAAAMERAQESDRLKSEFVASMNHELRTPLNHVIGFTEVVLAGAGETLSPEHREYLGHVRESGGQLLSLLNDVLDMARVQTGRIALSCRETGFAPVLQESLALVRDAAVRDGISLSSDLEGIPATGCFDAQRVTQVLVKLLTNALKFTPPGGTVTLRARPRGESVEVSVVDTGIGLDPGDLERIFAPFERTQEGAGKSLPGAGLGLTLARTLVELHGGRIWAESPGKGRGCMFRFTIPLRPKAGGEVSPGAR